MKKRRYSSIHVKQVRTEVLAEQIGGNELVIGLDVAKDEQFAALATADEPDGIRTLRFDLCEARSFVALVQGLEASHVIVVMEPSGTYGDPFAELARLAGWEVRHVSGKKTFDARELFDGVPSSHDAKSCHLLLRLHFQGLSTPALAKSSSRRDISAALSTMQRRQAALAVMRGQLEGLLARYWPELSSVLGLTRPTLLSLLASFAGPEEVSRAPKLAGELLRRVGRSFLAEEKIQDIVRSAQGTVGVPMTDGERAELKALAEDMCSAHELLKKSKKSVESLAAQTSRLATTIDTTGKATALAIYCELGDVMDYSCAAAYEKAFGLNLRHTSSGKKQGQLSITKRGSARARQALYFVALRYVKRDVVGRAWYQAKKSRDSGLPMKAIVAVMRKLARALWHVGRGDKFDSRKLFDVRRLGLTLESVEKEACTV